MNQKKLWIVFISVIVVSFAVLGYFGHEIYRKAPPVPDKVVTTDGTVLFTGKDIKNGQNVWQSMGGQEMGTVWGHGAYVAPDWTADWLHREATYMLNHWAKKDYGMSYDSLNKENQAMLKTRLQEQLRKNNYDTENDQIVVSPLVAESFRAISKHYAGLFTDDPSLHDLREAYAIPANTLKDMTRVNELNTFFFWATWATSTDRPGSDITYTNNWPAEELIGNKPTSSLILWTGFSVIVLIAGIGLLAFYYASQKSEDVDPSQLPAKDPLLGKKPTPSMKAP